LHARQHMMPVLRRTASSRAGKRNS
jgi:hypothetical protein